MEHVLKVKFEMNVASYVDESDASLHVMDSLYTYELMIIFHTCRGEKAGRSGEQMCHQFRVIMWPPETQVNPRWIDK